MSENPENSGNIRNEKGQFVKGVSGNPAGKPPGTQHTLTGILKRELFENGEQGAIELVRKIKQQAKDGDYQSQKLIMNYIDGMPKQSLDVKHDLPEALIDLIKGSHEGITDNPGDEGISEED